MNLKCFTKLKACRDPNIKIFNTYKLVVRGKKRHGNQKVVFYHKLECQNNLLLKFSLLRVFKIIGVVRINMKIDILKRVEYPF